MSKRHVSHRQIRSWQQMFLKMLPTIRRYAEVAFRGLKPESREDAIADVVSNTWCAFVRLVKQDKAHLAFPTVLANFAVRQYRSGRRTGAKLNVQDVMSPYAQTQKHFFVARLDKFDKFSQEWMEALVEDDRTPVPDQVAFRIDFPTWLGLLSSRDRRIALKLASGERTGLVARLFHLSDGRVSQLRAELHAAWLQFHGELLQAPDAA